MYKFDDVGGLYESLPPNLQSIENECTMYAIDKQLCKLYAMAKKLTVWSDLDHVDPKYYDLIAMCINIPYYRSDYSNEKKLRLIKNALKQHRFAGTRTAIETLLNDIFDNAFFIPWYEYGGNPYHFKIIVYDRITEETEKEFSSILRRVKAKRSVLDSIKLGREMNVENNVCFDIRISKKNVAIYCKEEE